MKDKVCVITGANSGIGKETSKKLAEMEAHIVMVCRDEQRGKEALKEIKDETQNNKIDLMLCDFASFNSINQYVEDMKNKYDKIDVLINNHGIFKLTKDLTQDGIEMTFQVNHLGYFTHTLQLLDLVKKSSYARIVNVASGSHYQINQVNLDDYNYEERRYRGDKAYAESKLYNVMFSFYLAEKLKGTEITVNALHPGFVKTNIALNNWFLKLIGWFIKLPAIPPEEGANTSIYLASSSEVDDVTGKYYSKMKEKKAKEIAYNTQLQQKLWDLSLELCKVEDPFNEKTVT